MTWDHIYIAARFFSRIGFFLNFQASYELFKNFNISRITMVRLSV